MKDTYQTIFETTGTAMVIYGEDTVVRLVNTEFEKMSGYSKSELEGKKSWTEFVGREDIEKTKNHHALGLSESGRAQRNYEFRFVDRWGRSRDIFMTVAVIPGKRVRVASLMDISERKQSELYRRKSEERYHTLFEHSRDAIIITTVAGRFIDANNAAQSLFGYSREEMMSLRVEDIYRNPEDWNRLLEEITAKESLRDYEVKMRRKDSTVMDCLLTITVWRDEIGGILGYQAIIRDVTEKKRTEETIWRLAYHDALTGLPNRLLFRDRLLMAIAHAQRNGHKLAVMMLDLDRFKFVNDTLGHNIGDLLLKVVGDRLKSILRRGDTVSRIGGDEFMLLLAEIVHSRDASMIARKILRVFREPFVFDGNRLLVTTSIGIAIYPDDGEDADTLIKNADIAMYRVKEIGRNDYRRFKPAMAVSVSL